MLHFGSILLTAVLLGVPRALEARAFGAQRSVYVEVSPADPELAGFADELARAIEGAGHTLVPRKPEATVVVEVHRLWRSQTENGRPTEAVSFTVHDGGKGRPLVLHYASRERGPAARILLRSLSEPLPTAS